MPNSADPDQLASPTDLELQCLQRQGISGFNRTRVNSVSNVALIITAAHAQPQIFYDSTPVMHISNTGPSCSKLTMSLVNDSLKFTSSDTQIY